MISQRNQEYLLLLHVCIQVKGAEFNYGGPADQSDRKINY